MSARAPAGESQPRSLRPRSAVVLPSACPGLRSRLAGTGDVQLRVPVFAEVTHLSTGTILPRRRPPGRSGQSVQPLSLGSPRLAQEQMSTAAVGLGMVAVGSVSQEGTWMWPLCSRPAGPCFGCDKGAPCPGWGTVSTSTVRLGVMGGEHVPRRRWQMLQPPRCPAAVPSRGGTSLAPRMRVPASSDARGWDRAGHRGAGRCHRVSLHRSPRSPPAGRRGQHPGGHHTALPSSPHRLRALPLPEPPPVPSIPCSCALPPPSGQGVWAGAGLLGAARPTAHCHLPACCCHGVSAKGESRYRNGSCSTSSLPCTGGNGVGGAVWPRSTPGVVCQEAPRGVGRSLRTRCRPAAGWDPASAALPAGRARPSCLPQARPAPPPVLFLKEYNVLFQCRALVQS